MTDVKLPDGTNMEDLLDELLCLLHSDVTNKNKALKIIILDL